MKIIVHADDFGFTKGITDNIVECIDNGTVKSTSVIPNGYAVDYAMQQCRKRENLRLGIHLNLAEGKPLIGAEKATLLVDEKGYFKHSFQSLWLGYALGSKEKKSLLRQQVRQEMSAQIGRIRNALPESAEINVDSHRHFHMIPFVFAELLGLQKEHNISYIRIPLEPFFLAMQRKDFLRNYFGLNLAKHFLLNFLSGGKKRLLAGKGIRCNDYFIGNLFAGNMSEEVARAALPAIKKKGSVVELLFHPGFAADNERKCWQHNREFAGFYYSRWRQKEFNTVKSNSFFALVRKFNRETL